MVDWKPSTQRALQASPEFKGIKTPVLERVLALDVGFKPALNSKGLRLRLSNDAIEETKLQASPEFKGIKTP